MFYCFECPPTDIGDNLTGWATVAIALLTFFLVLSAYLQGKDIKRVIIQNGFSIFLDQENNLLSKRKAVAEIGMERDQLMNHPDRDINMFHQISSIDFRLDIAVQEYLITLDRFSYRILNDKELPADELRNIYAPLVETTLREYLSEIERTPFRNIKKLHAKWNINT